jgi:Flp pilus assembly protein CpaB
MQTKVPLIIAIVFGIFAFVGIQQYLKSKEKVEAMSTVLAMARARNKGEQLLKDDIARTVIPLSVREKLTGFCDPNNQGLYIGNELAVDMKPGDILMEQSFKQMIPEAETFTFDTKLQEGERAISVEIDSAGALGSFLRIGDRVDILANLEVPDKSVRTITVPNQGPQTIEELTFRPTTVFLFENVKVLAIGDEFVETPGLSMQRTRSMGSTTTVTIAVTPREAQILSFAMRHGRKDTSGGSSSVTFTLLLRKQTDPGTVSPRQEVTYSDVLNMTDLQKLQGLRNDRIKAEVPEVILGGKPQ